MDKVTDRTPEGTQEVTADAAGGPAASTVPLTGAITVDAAKVREHVDAMVRDSVEQTLNALLDAEADRVCQASRYQRSPDRQDTRAGSYTRKLQTKAGEVELKVPRLRKLPLETAIIERYKRRESSVEEALVEMYLAGVSMRRVEDITEALWGVRTSASTVSQMAQKVYGQIEAWRNRKIEGSFAYVSHASIRTAYRQYRRRQRDKLVDGICRDAGLKIIHIRARASYSAKILRDMLDDRMRRPCLGTNSMDVEKTKQCLRDLIASACRGWSSWRWIGEWGCGWGKEGWFFVRGSGCSDLLVSSDEHALENVGDGGGGVVDRGVGVLGEVRHVFSEAWHPKVVQDILR